MDPEGVAVVGVGGAGMRQLVWQFAACELHDIMQFVTVEVTWLGSPVCASRSFPSAKAPGVLEQTAAATTRIARPSMTCPPIREEHSSIAERGVVRTPSRHAPPFDRIREQAHDLCAAAGCLRTRPPLATTHQGDGRVMTESIIARILSGIPPGRCIHTHPGKELLCRTYPDVPS
jgi:hypothetical protein